MLRARGAGVPDASTQRGRPTQDRQDGANRTAIKRPNSTTHGDYRHALHVGTMPDSEQVRASPKRQYFVQSALCTLTQCWPPSQVIGGQLKSLHEAITSALPHHELQFRDQIHQLVSCLVSRRVCSVLCHQRQVGYPDIFMTDPPTTLHDLFTAAAHAEDLFPLASFCRDLYRLHRPDAR